MWLESEELKDKKWVFIASCVVTDRAKKKWIREVKETSKKLTAWENIFLSGCGAFNAWKKDENFYTLYPELWDLKDKIILLEEAPKKEVIQKSKNLWLTKKFILIQRWCDSHCSFCLTVKKRGPHSSREKEAILQDILDFEKNWGKEVVLTGINLSAWGLKSTREKWKSRLAELLFYILENTNIPRIRISSLGPEFVDDALLELCKEKRIYPHFHLSLQSWSDKVLKLMGRQYDKKTLIDILEKLRNIRRKDGVNISIGADIITWFPWETEKDFMETCNLVEKYQINKIHCFPFSAHLFWETVPASFFPDQVSEVIKKERQKILLKKAENIRNNFISWEKGKSFEVLVEKVRGNTFSWWTENYIEVNEENFEIKKWTIKKNEIIFWVLK